ncbi:MAG: phenylalanine--tRNA ligase subunit alpha [Chloroflexi bacterium]|nr:MAG: phenylalanine--tRNA ligase subunit alpha [Chloroflexota bacterium]
MNQGAPDRPSSDDLRIALEEVRAAGLAALAQTDDPAAVGSLRSGLLGRSGRLTALLREIAHAQPSERPALGRLANEVRAELEATLDDRQRVVRREALQRQLAAEAIDMTAPGRPVAAGHLHPLMTAEREVREIFHGFGFEVIEGPEIETDEMNFERLNIPPDHPSRDLWDTLYVAEPGSVEAGAPRPAEDGTILRTHTSPVQIRAMKALKPPIRVVIPGRCFRYEAVDAGHNFEFFQVEGLVVDRETSLADLKGTLEAYARAMYGPETRTRFRPGYYPFTEPSVAFDVGCVVCAGEGCPACQRTGWMTILGAGMVHPVVLRNGGLDPELYQGYAFGMGLDRMTLLRYGIPDLRLLMGSDLRFLEQFSDGR